MLISSVANHLAPPTTGYVMNSPLLFSLFEQWCETDYYEILDIAPANQQQLDYFSQLHCKLFLPGCGEELLAMRLDDYDTNFKINRALLEKIPLSGHRSSTLNLIMLWDLPNYLEPQLLHQLIDYLLPFSKRDVMLHTYIHTREFMPEIPGKYHFRKDNKIEVAHPSAKSVLCPMYYQDALQKILTPFLVQKGILLSNGFQEYLLIRQ